MSNFKIDFFEFSFLVEATIPPAPIARTMFFNNVIDKYYHDMTDAERNRLFEWITSSHKFNIENEQCDLFYKRYDPNNQYLVTTNYNDEIQTLETFKVGEHYHTKSTTSILEEYITKIEHNIRKDVQI